MSKKTRPMTDSLWAAFLIAKFAQEIGLPPGNMWEPGMTRRAERMVAEMGREDTAKELRFSLGLNDPSGGIER